MVFFISKGEAWLVYSIEGFRAVDRRMVESYSRYDSHWENLIKLSTFDHWDQTIQFMNRRTDWNYIMIPIIEPYQVVRLQPSRLVELDYPQRGSHT